LQHRGSQRCQKGSPNCGNTPPRPGGGRPRRLVSHELD
jgi:hypothetical protein